MDGCLTLIFVKSQDVVPDIALDIGCAVGRSTFELSKKFSKVVGIDYSQAFIDCSNQLKKYGELPYSVTTEGSLVSQRVAEVDADIVSCHDHNVFLSLTLLAPPPLSLSSLCSTNILFHFFLS